MRPLLAGLKSTLHLPCCSAANLWCTGRIRTSVAHNAADLQSAAINHSATCALRLQNALKRSTLTPVNSQSQDYDKSHRIPGGTKYLEGVVEFYASERLAGTTNTVKPTAEHPYFWQ